MMRKLAIVAGGLVLVVGGLFAVSARSLSDLTGYFRATADTTVDNLTEQIPEPIQDRKLENELHVARQQLIDRQVELNLSRSQVDQLRKDVQNLEGSVARRQRLLAEAYPVMKDAVAQNQTAVRFASTDFAMPDFQKEVDDLLAQQERESRQLAIKRDGLARLEKSLSDGERALTEMRTALEGLDQEVAVLKSRREQAQVEGATLDLISSATAGQQTAATSVGQSVERLKQDVAKLEARNDARRGLAPVAERPANQLGRAWSRLESLKAFHDAVAAQPPAGDAVQAPGPAAVADAGQQASLEAAEVHITIRPEDKAAARKSKKPAEKK
jgi:chromosome segregation ATPase